MIKKRKLRLKIKRFLKDCLTMIACVVIFYAAMAVIASIVEILCMII